MKIPRVSFPVSLLSATLILFITQIPAMINRTSDIHVFHWVKNEMKIEADYLIPAIKRAARSKLEHAYVNLIKRTSSYKEAVAQSEKGEADKALWERSKQVRAFLFISTGDIYVDISLSKSETDSLIAHEYCHYLQEETLGPAIGITWWVERWKRETQAYDIQDKYISEME